MQLFVVLVKLTNVVVALVKVAAAANAPDGAALFGNVGACVGSCVCVLMTAEVHLI